MSKELQVNELGQKIYLIRGHRVMLDSDLAELYEVELRALNQAVKRNVNRFPDDFMFQLTANEYDSLRSQFVTLKKGRGSHRKYRPLVFTEQGVSMLSSVLNSERAIQVNIAIIRTFVKIREMLSTNKELAKKIDQLEKTVIGHDAQIKEVFNAVRQLISTGLPTTQKKIKGLSKE